MQRTISLAAAKSSSSTSVLSLHPLMAKLQCRAIQNFPASSSSSVVRVDRVYRNVSQLQFKRENSSCLKLACALPSHLSLLGSLSYATHWSSSTSRAFGYSFRPFARRYFSQVASTEIKDSIVGGVEKFGGNKIGFKKFNKKWKKHRVLASTKAEVVASTEPVIGDVNSGIKAKLSTAASPASNAKQASTVKTKRQPKSKKFEDKSSPTVSVLETVSVDESLQSFPKPRHSGSGNRKSSSAEYSSQKEVVKKTNVEGPKSSTPSNSMSEQQHWTSTKASNAPKQEQDNIVGGDEKAGGNKVGFKKFNKNRKKHNVLASSEAEVVTSTEPVIGDGSSGIKAELSTAASPASNGNQATTVKSKRRPKNKKVEDKSSSVVPVLEAVSLDESPISVPKPKHSGSGNRKSSSAKKEVAKNHPVEEPKSPAPSNSKSEQQHLKSTKASKAPKQKLVPQHMKNSIEHRGQNASKPLYPPSGKSVIVVESMTKAKIIQGYLGDMYEVLPSYGHIRDLATRAENLILASDPDREGEAIAWHIIEMLQQQGALHESMTVARVVFHEITESAIKSALQSPREIDGDLVHAYLARRALDYLIGFNISPLLWRKLPGCPSAGRVQSAALALVCDRESEIDGFKPQEYWTVGIKVKGKDNSATFSAHLTSLNSKRLNQLSISSEANAQDIEQRIKSEGFLVKGTKTSTTRKNPPTPYITSTLQQDAANKLHFSTAHTMKIADEAIKDIQSLVAERYGKNFTSDSPRKYFKKVKNAQEAHEAIRPTDIRRLPSTIASLLDADSLKLYTLIWSRAVACQMEPASIAQIQLDIGNASESIIFRSSCSKVEFLGYQAVYEDPEAKAIKNNDNDQSSEREETFKTLSSLKDGDLLQIGEVELKQHHTQHPPRYSEGSLVKKLEELGIGRPSTYASIFRVLQHRKYVTIKNRVLYPEFRARMVSAFLTHYFTEITDYSFTADMETELDNVSGGVTEWKGLLRDYWTRFSAYCKRVENVQRSQLYGRHLKFQSKFIAKTLYGEDEDEDDPPKNNCVEEPKLLGLHPNTSEKVILKCGPYGHYVQLGEDKKGHTPKRANAAHIKDVNSITLESALELLRYPLTLGTHPEDGQPVVLKLSKSGFTIKHRRNMATVPKNTEPGEVTLERAMKLLSGKNVRKSGRPPKSILPEEEKGDEEVVVAI
ncbi:DNA topoisomerase like-protein [Arabidopsis thaliana]|uniref:DNA topoisomerase n=1 Tax=Arabidopsis thaliana TaxID=3702 RepID=O49571_ARATH|nr:DNA topoisomerase like-protein [Arabidopsis thaliana]CAB79839.1 DNA topoisomerase like-protein [Arabidopsis thaliana]